MLKDFRNPLHQFLALCKWAISFRKTEWVLSDYPVFVRKQAPHVNDDPGRLKLVPYFASIVNWYTLSGSGDTKPEAIADLEINFERQRAERRKNQKALPRPGTHVPVEFAENERVEAHRELADDFIKRVLELEWAWISDESSLWDFHGEENNDALAAKVKNVYGVDISDLASGKLCDIFERIVREDKHQRWR